MRLLFLATTLISLCAAPSFAGGLYANEFGTSSQANAGAGRGAWVPDASALLHNPAAMTRLDDHAISTGLGIAIIDVEFDADGDSPSGSRNGGNQGGVAPLASFNYVHWISERFRVGLTFYSLSGSILDPNDDWAGRFEVTELSLLTLSFAPSVAYQVNDWLSIGAGPVVSYGVLDWDLAVDLPFDREGALELDKLDDWQATGRVGILLTPRDDFSLSVHYIGETSFDLKGDTDTRRDFEFDFGTELPIAQSVEVSAWWQATAKLALLATFNWEDWSTADKLDIELEDADVEASVGFRDTYKVGVGANYLLDEEWLLQTGFMWDSASLKDKHRTTALPSDQQFRVAFGVKHQFRPSLVLGASFVYVNLDDAEVSTPRVSGDYSRNQIFVLGFSVDFNDLPWSRNRDS